MMTIFLSTTLHHRQMGSTEKTEVREKKEFLFPKERKKNTVCPPPPPIKLLSRHPDLSVPFSASPLLPLSFSAHLTHVASKQSDVDQAGQWFPTRGVAGDPKVGRERVRAKQK